MDSSTAHQHMAHQHQAANHSDMAAMKMYFHFGFENQFLFGNFDVDSRIKMWSVCAALFLVTVLFEAIKYVRCVRCGCQIRKTHCTPESGDLQDDNTIVRVEHNCYVGQLRGKKHRLIQSILHTVQTSLGLLIMLSAMSFNLCIIFAILVGTGVGYYIFYRPYNEVEAIDSCH